MKVWNGYGSEHSANLVMIGTFKSAASAEEAKKMIDEITDFVSNADEDFYDATRYGEKTSEFLNRINFYSAGPSDLSQFRLGFQFELKEDKIILSTDESEISAVIKVFLAKGARVEVYSAHDYPETGK